MTNFSVIFDQFMQFVSDYRLISLYNASPTDFETYLSGFLIPAISDFRNCNQSLAYSGTTFTESLTPENVKILALLLKKYWLKKEIADISQMRLHITDRDFKTFAEANNLREKQNTYNNDLEEVSQLLVSYGLDNTDWAAWFNGEYYVPS